VKHKSMKITAIELRRHQNFLAGFTKISHVTLVVAGGSGQKNGGREERKGRVGRVK